MTAESDPVVLSREGEGELADAMAEHVQPMRESSGVQPAEPSAATRKRAAPSGSAARAVAARFQAKLGVQELCKVKRKGTLCMFCDGELPKDSWKFIIAWKKNKPNKSMHVTCVPAMDRECAQNSMGVLREMQTADNISAEEREICGEALASLQERLTTAA